MPADYANPTIERAGDVVKLDVGYPPGELKPSLTTFDKVELASPLVEDGEWSTAEAVRFLKLAIAAHPDAQRYEVRVHIPRMSFAGVWVYAYDRSDDRVHVKDSVRGSPWRVSPPVQGDVGALTTLRTRDLAYER